MELIRPPKLKNYLLRRGQVHQTEVLSELGVYGIWLSDGPAVHLNESGGHLLRTKTSSSNEGGVAAGFAVLDSPYLVS
jgi:glutathione synthase